jgi:hypothetical protein
MPFGKMDQHLILVRRKPFARRWNVIDQWGMSAREAIGKRLDGGEWVINQVQWES